MLLFMKVLNVMVGLMCLLEMLVLIEIVIKSLKVCVSEVVMRLVGVVVLFLVSLLKVIFEFELVKIKIIVEINLVNVVFKVLGWVVLLGFLMVMFLIGMVGERLNRD